MFEYEEGAYKALQQYCMVSLHRWKVLARCFQHQAIFNSTGTKTWWNWKAQNCCSMESEHFQLQTLRWTIRGKLLISHDRLYSGTLWLIFVDKPHKARLISEDRNKKYGGRLRTSIKRAVTPSYVNNMKIIRIEISSICKDKHINAFCTGRKNVSIGCSQLWFCASKSCSKYCAEFGLCFARCWVDPVFNFIIENSGES